MSLQHITRRISTQDLFFTSLIGLAVIIVLSLVSGISLLHAFIAGVGFCGCLVLYARLVPLEIGEPTHVQKRTYDNDTSLREQAQLADGFAEAMIIINKNENILYANQDAHDLFSLEEMGGALSSHVRDPKARQLVTDILAGEKPEPVTYHLEVPVERHIRIVGAPIFDQANSTEVHRAILVFYDITDLVRSNTMRAEFLANASHELKTPIASLLGYIETLRGHARDDEEARETFLGIMQQQAERMQRLIDDLLSLRRIEMVEHLLPTETADLYLASRAAIESVTPLADERNIKINYNGPKKVPVTGIQDELVQVVLNLLDNAVVISPDGCAVELSIDLIPFWNPTSAFSGKDIFDNSSRRRIVVPGPTARRYARLRLRDAGPGFVRETLPRLGERFYKVEDSAGHVKRGTGLGLAIVKHIIRRHRGGLLIESEVNMGTEFTVLIPTANEDA